MFNYQSSIPTINPDEERAPPPAPTLVYFPQNDVELTADNNWVNHPPNLFKDFSHLAKPTDVHLEHLLKLNVAVENDVDLDTLVPISSDGVPHLPPRILAKALSSKHMDPKSAFATTTDVFSASRDPLLSNGYKTPDIEIYAKFTRELVSENEDALRVIWRKKARPSHPAPNLSYYRKFWGHLESMFLYWDTSLDHYYEINESAAHEKTPPKSPRGLKRLSVALGHKESLADARKPASNKRYKGRRNSTGSKMPEHHRIEIVRIFVEPLAWIFGCSLMQPRKIPHMEIKTLLIPVTQTSQMWRTPQDKAQAKRGLTEGPVIGIQCRAETGFVKDKQSAELDIAREIAGLLLLAQERAREGKPKVIPGSGKWYTTKPRWGGGPGGEFGEAEGNTDPVHSHTPTTTTHGRRQSGISLSSSKTSRSEEEIWKELKPGPGLWDPRHVYLSVGRDRGEQFDNVFMVSSLFHHISILRLSVHPLYVDYLISGKPPASAPPDADWHRPQVKRSRWYDLLVPDDRVEAMRALWGVMSYLMRSGETVNLASAGQRQKSEVHHHFPFRKKSQPETGPAANRSASVAF